MWPCPIYWVPCGTPTLCAHAIECGHTCMQACVHACIHACMHVCMHACMHAGMHAGRQASRQASEQAGRQAGRQAGMHACMDDLGGSRTTRCDPGRGGGEPGLKAIRITNHKEL